MSPGSRSTARPPGNSPEIEHRRTPHAFAACTRTKQAPAGVVVVQVVTPPTSKVPMSATPLADPAITRYVVAMDCRGGC
jgi:hypothetical protein